MTEVGAGVHVWPRTWEMLKRLGLEESLTKLLATPPKNEPTIIFQFRKADQPGGVLLKEWISNDAAVRFHRAELQKALVDSLEGRCRFHLSCRLQSYEETNEQVRLRFENGLIAECNLLIGADGIKSVVRKEMLQKSGRLKGDEGSIEPIWSGEIAYRGLIPLERLKQVMPNHRATKLPMMHMVVYPITQESVVNVVGSVRLADEGALWAGPQVTEVPKEEFEQRFTGWEEEVQALIKCIDKPTRWALFAIRPLSCYAHQRVILLGDSAHAMTPHLGAGAGQAIEDGYVLADILSKYSLDLEGSLKEITTHYDRIRRPFGNWVLRESYIQGMRSELTAPGLEGLKEGDAKPPMEKLYELLETMVRTWDWAWDTSVASQHTKAIAKL
ncbi:salicylate hydroxylase [Pluteus cervinus]|uniref:Salicylate hydroxylase n=1 Tax=Pluteus cervinus TaxID=181527 RepID=A0ACD3AXJ1_9AGAR|nr:salicylate hydroxylase [Pluteus cervinus]